MLFNPLPDLDSTSEGSVKTIQSERRTIFGEHMKKGNRPHRARTIAPKDSIVKRTLSI